MKKTLTYTTLLTCLAFYMAWLTSGCKKDHGDGSGDSCFTTVYAPVDSVQGGNTIKIFDTLELMVWCTGPSACYDHVVVKDAGLSNTNQLVKATMDLIHCLDCPAATTPRRGIYKFVANQVGTWTLTFYNTSGNLNYTVNVTQ